MPKIEVDAIDKQSGSTLTLGGSGTAVTLACGATQSGFGRGGSVNWQTSIKTATFTAASGEGYFCNTSGGAFTVNLPSSPSVGDIVAIKDYASSFDTQNLTIGRGGSNMNGSASDSTRDTENESLTLVYADATKGWISVEEGTGFVGENFLTASGGTITCSPCGNFKIHTFTGPGTFTVSALSTNPVNNIVSYAVVGGGGGGGGSNVNPPGPYSSGGGAGAGGFREGKNAPVDSYTASPIVAPAGLPVSVQSYPIAVGGGGAGGGGSAPGTVGVNSSFSTITSAGGGFGNHRGASASAGDGGSGGGGSGNTPNPAGYVAGTGNTPPVSPAQGFNGGNGSAPPYPANGANAGGGGGATAVGGAAVLAKGGNGGAGATSSINGTPTARAGGGGGGSYVCGASGTSGSGAGGTGGGGPGACSPGALGPAVGSGGTVNTGGGGGGGQTVGPDVTARGGGSGGSGIVIIRYKYQ